MTFSLYRYKLIHQQPHKNVQITDYTYPLLGGTRTELKFENKNIVTTLNIISIIENICGGVLIDFQQIVKTFVWSFRWPSFSYKVLKKLFSHPRLYVLTKMQTIRAAEARVQVGRLFDTSGHI